MLAPRTGPRSPRAGSPGRSAAASAAVRASQSAERPGGWSGYESRTSASGGRPASQASAAARLATRPPKEWPPTAIRGSAARPLLPTAIGGRRRRPSRRLGRAHQPCRRRVAARRSAAGLPAAPRTAGRRARRGPSGGRSPGRRSRGLAARRRAAPSLPRSRTPRGRARGSGCPGSVRGPGSVRPVVPGAFCMPGTIARPVAAWHPPGCPALRGLAPPGAVVRRPLRAPPRTGCCRGRHRSRSARAAPRGCPAR